ncbi:DUF2089 domain-containing protein [Caldalkalibacillus salinus]|uniref:DUF2089 domain-containing protein n=1 Tax=Caldalkalibacillus salinus TaxID=2803787 RepID=UPI0019249C3F|nr:DUF2089 domain-containing protein [Caldalkalibacillus salinus]
MKHPIPEQCPVCRHELIVKELHCDHCQTTIQGHFEASTLTSLSQEQLKFVETFIKVRGSIKEMERALNISYPTVRNRLEQVIDALEHRTGRSEGNQADLAQRNGDDKVKASQKDILNALDQGDISSSEALRLLQDI